MYEIRLLLYSYLKSLHDTYNHIGPSPLDSLPPNFLHDVEAAGDRLVAKAEQLIQNKTTNISENFMSTKGFR